MPDSDLDGWRAEGVDYDPFAEAAPSSAGGPGQVLEPVAGNPFQPSDVSRAEPISPMHARILAACQDE
jgi:hypothetical protein